MTPSLGAVTVCSIFMASRIAIAVPRSTESPSATAMESTFPGMGATQPESRSALSVDGKRGAWTRRNAWGAA